MLIFSGIKLFYAYFKLTAKAKFTEILNVFNENISNGELKKIVLCYVELHGISMTIMCNIL